MTTTELESQERRSVSTSRTAPEEVPASFIRRRVPFLFSIRFGLTAWYVGVLILTLTFSGVALRTLLVRSLDQDSETRLRNAAGEVLDEIIDGQDSISPPGEAEGETPVIMPDLDVQSIVFSGVSVTVVDASGDLKFRRGMLAPVWPPAEDYEAYLQYPESRYYHHRLPSGYTIRGLAVPIPGQAVDQETGEQQIAGMIFTSESQEIGNRVVNLLNQVILLAGVAGVAIAGVGGWVLAGRALAPVNRIMNSAEDIAKGKGAVSLSRRLDVPMTGDEIAQLAETFNDMLDRIEEAFAAQRRFVGDASHELRTPLTSIKGNVDVLRRQIALGRSMDPGDFADSLADVGREADRMGRLVDDLLALARTDAEGFGSLVNLDVVSLDVLAHEAVRTAEVLVDGQELVLEAPEPVMVHGDGDRLVQVMLILLDNALRHTPEGGTVTLSIAMGIDPQDHIPCARIDVSDTGKGISAEHLPHLFERFYRAEGSRSRLDGGTGLGLSIALSIVRSHGGWIDVESAPGSGTHFTVWIPVPADDVLADVTTQTTGRRLPMIPRRR